MKSADLARMIDRTILRPDATEQDVITVCREAVAHRFHAVCINPRFVPLVARELRGSDVRTCSVIGFPLGASTTAIKSAEAAEAISGGASEIDMVMAIGALKVSAVSSTPVRKLEDAPSSARCETTRRRHDGRCKA